MAFALIMITGLILFACAPVNIDVYVHMMHNQEIYLREEVVPAFEAENRVKIDIRHYEFTDRLHEILGDDNVKPALVKIPFDKSAALMRKNILMPLDSIISEEDLEEFKKEYLLMSLGALDGKQYLVPRKFETRIMVFCKSKVSEAVLIWREYRDQISTELKKYNGYGLPDTYLLEEDPESWDYYDIFVVGWIWANRTYNGKKMARIAHRGQNYSGTSLRIIDRVFQLNGDISEVNSMKGDGVIDAFYWEAVYVSAGIFNPQMWEKRWAGNEIWQGFGRGEVFLSFMTQLDCFFIHGTGKDGLNGFLENPDDMGVATMPVGCSMELNTEKGVPRRIGKKTISTGGWWWGIPKDSPAPAASFKFLSYITGVSAQIQEGTRFGMIPVRKNVLEDIQMLFGGMWISDIYNVSLKQLMHNGNVTIGSDAAFEKISSLYLEAWNDIVVNRNWSSDKMIPSREYISKLLDTKYGQKITEMASVK